MKYLEDNDTENSLLTQFFEDYPNDDDEKVNADEGIALLIKIKNLKPGEKLNNNPNEKRLRLTMFDEITSQHIDETTERYRKQMPSVIQKADKDKELKYVRYYELYRLCMP